MKTLRLAIVGMVFTAVFAVSAFSQTVAPKIAVINTLAFGAKGGITKYVNAQKKLNDEFKVENQQLTALATKINNLKKEIQTLRNNTNKSVPVAPATVNNKIEEHNNLEREFKFKQDNAKAKLAARSAVVLDPVRRDIFKALQEYATKKGYGMILDASRLEQAQLILAFDQKFNMTKDFIAYYNTRPAGTASK
jgi:Skp family chaperone for outer membrane proteins